MLRVCVIAGFACFATMAEAETLTCSPAPAPQNQVSVSGGAGGQNFVFRISVDGVPLPDDQTASKESKPKPTEAACDFTS
ncbi:hypothetical protein [Aestuariivirga litoralis]|uniref:hypothetical protein n=1 Tax=Aestuariivirga litoralis TaxID=2650924 RepID=UPI0018C4E24C|nr:hypothetical protein [Aestuariivirga litoralis]MBG1233386.1 hypothetical protein [Aestuariivirga litoralis]